MPINSKGTCGLVGLSMLLGYLDVFGNPNIISGDNYNGDINEINLFFENNNSVIADKMNIRNLIDMPGTNEAFQNLLFDNYLHTIMGIKGNDHPMAATELEKTY